MQKIRIVLLVFLTLAVLACEEEGPAISEEAADEAPVVGAELEEDTGLKDDAPIGEPEVMNIAGHEGVSDQGHGMESVTYEEVPPASRAVQETPSLPGGDSTAQSGSTGDSMGGGAARVGGTGASAEAGAGIYAARCATCHGVRGAGDTTIGRSNEIAGLSSTKVQSLNDPELAAIIRGDAGIETDQAHRKISLSDEQVQDVISWIRTL